jgi:integrase/recombinase XerD
MTIAIVQDKKKQTTTGENAGKYHVKIRLTKTVDKKTIQRYFMTGIFASDEEFKKIRGNGKKSDDIKEKETKLNALYEKAKQILASNPFIDPDDFGTLLLAKGSYKDPLKFILAYAEELKREGRVGTSEYYRLAYASFKQFSNGAMSFAAVNAKWLMRYEKHMIDHGKSITTVGMYCRALRTIFNMARSDQYKIIPKDMYPFGRGGYVIPTSRGRKLALDEEQKNKLLKFKTKITTINPKVQRAGDLWIFSYFCNGMNFADIAALKFKHIHDDILTFERTKTMLTNRNKEAIIIVLRPEVKEIINLWGNVKDSKNPEAYVFNVLRDGLTPAQVSDRVHTFVLETNKLLKEICEELEIPIVTTYWARHTFATIAKRKGASLAAIREAMGHANEKTTQAYLDSFDIESKKQIANML